MNPILLSLTERIAHRWAQLPEVETVAIAGSQATGTAGSQSDIDVYIYAHADIPALERAAIAREFSSSVEIVDYWGPGLEWDDSLTGVHVDQVFFTTGWIEVHIERVVQRHEASLGYTTSFWHTVRISHVVYDRSGWFTQLQQMAAVDYPDGLVKAIIALNHPALRQITSSYLNQLAKAASRNDVVSLNHRTAALLASYFDILYAVNRLPHPGEKRLLDFVEAQCARRPSNMREDVMRLLESSVTPGGSIVSAVNQLLDGLDEVLSTAGLLPIY